MTRGLTTRTWTRSDAEILMPAHQGKLSVVWCAWSELAERDVVAVFSTFEFRSGACVCVPLLVHQVLQREKNCVSCFLSADTTRKHCVSCFQISPQCGNTVFRVSRSARGNTVRGRVSGRCERCASCVSLCCDSTSLCNTHKCRRAAHERSTRPMTTKSSHYLGQTL